MSAPNKTIRGLCVVADFLRVVAVTQNDRFFKQLTCAAAWVDAAVNRILELETQMTRYGKALAALTDANKKLAADLAASQTENAQLKQARADDAPRLTDAEDAQALDAAEAAIAASQPGASADAAAAAKVG